MKLPPTSRSPTVIPPVQKIPLKLAKSVRAADTCDVSTIGTNADYMPVFTDASGSGKTLGVDDGLTFNPSTNVLSTGTVTANLTGNVTGNTSGSSGSCTGNAAGLTGSPNITVGTVGCGAITGTSTISDSNGNVRVVPQNPASQTTSSSYTLVAGDSGKCIVAGSTVVIPNSTLGGGDVVSIINNSGSAITITASVNTLYNTADGATGNRTLAARGMATVIFMYGGTSAYISGSGLS